MKNLGLLLGVWFSLTSCLWAQVSVEIVLDQDQFLPGEALPIGVRIVNRSGQSLKLGEEGWLSFSIESVDKKLIAKKGEAPVEEPFTLDSSKRATVRVDLAPYFSVREPGHYLVTATVRIKEWTGQVTSEAKPFDIIHGSKLWEMEVGLPKVAGSTNLVPEMRRYTLHQANYLRKQLMLYVQITGSSGKIYKVFPAGPMISFGQPEAQTDRLSNLHVLYQDGARSFTYFAVDPDGNLFVRQAYDYTTRPQLRMDAEGNFKVIGGARRIKATDLPPPPTLGDSSTTTTPQGNAAR